MILGVYIYTFLIGSLSTLIASLDKKNEYYKNLFEDFIRRTVHMKIPPDMRRRVLFNLKNGTQFLSILFRNYDRKDHKFLFKGLPKKLKYSVSFSLLKLILKMNKEIITEIPLFANSPPRFTASILKKLRPMAVAAGSYIFIEGDPAVEFFFVRNGSLEFVLNKYNDFSYARLGNGFYFGATDLIFNKNVRRSTVKASTDCNLYRMNLKAFKKIFFKSFRDQGLHFIDMANQREKRLMRLKKEAIKACQKHYKDYDISELDASDSPPKLYLKRVPYLFKEEEAIRESANIESIEARRRSIFTIEKKSSLNFSDLLENARECKITQNAIENNRKPSLTEAQKLQIMQNLLQENPKQDRSTIIKTSDLKEITEMVKDSEEKIKEILILTKTVMKKLSRAQNKKSSRNSSLRLRNSTSIKIFQDIEPSDFTPARNYSINKNPFFGLKEASSFSSLDQNFNHKRSSSLFLKKGSLISPQSKSPLMSPKNKGNIRMGRKKIEKRSSLFLEPTDNPFFDEERFDEERRPSKEKISSFNNTQKEEIELDISNEKQEKKNIFNFLSMQEL